jgi:hypothetical protein
MLCQLLHRCICPHIQMLSRLGIVPGAFRLLQNWLVGPLNLVFVEGVLWCISGVFKHSSARIVESTESPSSSLILMSKDVRPAISSELINSSSFNGVYVATCITCPFCLRSIDVMAGPTPTEGPSHLPSTSFWCGKDSFKSQYFTHWYHPSSAKMGIFRKVGQSQESRVLLH